MFNLTRPDSIAQRGGVYRFTYAGDRDPHSLPIGAEYTVVYSLSDDTGSWYIVRYQVVPSPSCLTGYLQVVKQRALEADEIAHFEAMITEPITI